MEIVQLMYHLIISPFETFIYIVFNELFRMFEAYEIAIVGTAIIVFFACYPMIRQIEPVFLCRRKYNVQHRGTVFLSFFSVVLSIAIQIPLLIASCNFFTSNHIPYGISWMLIPDLTKADGLLLFGQLQVNILPIIVFVFYLISTFFSKDKDIVHIIYPVIMAIGFLIFLYDKPSSLSLFWMLISLFFFVFTVFMRNSKNTYETFWALLSGTSLLVTIMMLFGGLLQSKGRRLLFLAITFLCQIPILIIHFKSKNNKLFDTFKVRHNYVMFLVVGACLSLLLGMLVPFTVVGSSPTEYLQYGCNPFKILLSNFALYLGFFAVWSSIYYWRVNNTGKSIFQLVQWLFLGTCLLNFFFYNKNGVMNPNMTYLWGFESWGTIEKNTNLLFTVVVLIVFYLLLKNYSDYLKGISIVLLIAFSALSVVNSVNTFKQINDYRVIHREDTTVDTGILDLSVTGKNVVLIMLDRAANEFLPYILEEKDEIKDQLSGFVYFPNTLSYGDTTLYASSAIYGGYEYVPEEMNRRSNRLLKDKHNEALLILPTLFSESGYSVTTCDPPYANYEVVPDLRIFKGNTEIKTYNILCSDLDKKLDLDVIPDMSFDALKYNFTMYSFMKVAPTFLQEFIFDEGNYRKVIEKNISTSFLKSYSELDQLESLTSFSKENDIGSFIMIYNGLTHEPMSLQLPNYSISKNVNNSMIEPEFRLDEYGNILDLSNELVRNHYYSAVVAFEKLGKWFDYLRANEVFDNTRIVIVGDHAFSYSQESSRITANGHHIERLNPILIMKDFKSDTYTISDIFMTVADVPAICMEGVIDEPINPFTNIPFSKSILAKDGYQKVIYEEDSNADKVWSAENIFLSNEWYLVENDALDISKYHKIDRPYS